MTTITKSVDVDVPITTAYNQWTQFETFPQFMSGIQSVTQQSDTETHWKVNIGGVEWDIFEPADPSRAANISYALGTQAGSDYVLLYGSATAEQTADLATIVAPDVQELQGATR